MEKIRDFIKEYKIIGLFFFKVINIVKIENIIINIKNFLDRFGVGGGGEIWGLEFMFD